MPHTPEYLFSSDEGPGPVPCENHGCPVEDIILGDDPGFVDGGPAGNGWNWIAVCSEACTEAVLAALDDPADVLGAVRSVEVTATAEPGYEFTCAHTITCDVLADRHGRECEDINQQAREDHYADVVLSTPLGDLR